MGPLVPGSLCPGGGSHGIIDPLSPARWRPGAKALRSCCTYLSVVLQVLGMWQRADLGKPWSPNSRVAPIGRPKFHHLRSLS